MVFFWHYSTKCLRANPNSSLKSVDSERMLKSTTEESYCLRNDVRSIRSTTLAVLQCEVLHRIDHSFCGLWIPLSSR